MARGFGATFGAGSTDSIVSALNTASPGQRSYFIWFYLHGTGGGGLGRLFDRATGTAANEAFFHNNPALTFAAVWSTTSGAWNIVVPSFNVWHSALVTYDRGATTNDPAIYLDGSPVSVTQQGVDPSGTFDTSTQSFVLGNRGVDGARNWDGNLAEFAVWDNVLLGAAEAAALNKGASPLSIRPDKLVEYIPVLRANHSYKRAAPTITGTAVQPHPRIIMPRRTRYPRTNGVIVFLLHPDADDSLGGWTDENDGTTNIFNSIDEATTPNDADYIKSSVNPSTDVVRLRISDPATGVAEPFKVRYRAKQSASGTITLKVRLKEGTTLIKEWTHSSLTTSFQTFEQTLNTTEFNSIGNFSNLFVEFEGT